VSEIIYYTTTELKTALDFETIQEQIGSCRVLTSTEDLQHWLHTKPVDVLLVECWLRHQVLSCHHPPDFPVIILANPGEEPLLAEAIDQGCQHYLIRDPQQNYLHLLKPLIELAVRSHKQKLASVSSDYHLDFVENIDEIFWVSDAYRRDTRYLNSAFERVWQVSVSYARSETDFFINSIHLEDRSYVREMQALSSYPKHLIYRIVQPTGGVRWIQDKQFEVGSGDDILGVLQDITERKQAEHALQQSLNRERELSELKSHFISMASHQFRTPLAVIQAASDGLINYYERMSQEQIQNRLYRIQQKIQLIVSLLDDILTISHFEDGDVKLSPEKIQLKRYCNTLAHELIQANRFQQSFRAVYEPDDITVHADVLWLRQIIDNLLTNAFKYSTPSDTVTLRIYAEQSAVLLSVHNTGSTIPPGEINKLFEPFHRGGHASEISGTGLGLTIVKQAVELHHGTIQVQSLANEGTTFTVRLPL